MHMSMCFIRSVGALMTDSWLNKSLESTFGGIFTMLSGKIHLISVPVVYWWKNKCVSCLSEGGWWVSRYGDRNSSFERISQQNRPTKLWVD